MKRGKDIYSRNKIFGSFFSFFVTFILHVPNIYKEKHLYYIKEKKSQRTEIKIDFF